MSPTMQTPRAGRGIGRRIEDFAVTVLASRIGGLSGSSRLFIGPETYRSVQGDFACEFLGHREMKNVKGLVPIDWVTAGPPPLPRHTDEPGLPTTKL